MKKFLILVLFFFLSPSLVLPCPIPGNIFLEATVVAFGKGDFFTGLFTNIGAELPETQLKSAEIQLPDCTSYIILYVSYGGWDTGITIEKWEEDELSKPLNERKLFSQKFGKGEKFFSIKPMKFEISKKTHFSITVGEGVQRDFVILPSKSPYKPESSKH